MKLVHTLTTKKQFVLNTPMMAQISPSAMPLIRRGYDPAVGALFETVMTIAQASEEIERMTVTEIIDQRGPRIGGHLKSLLELAPPGLIDTMLNQITIEQTSDTTGFVITPNRIGGKDRSPWVKVGGRWVSKGFADGWAKSKDNLKDVLYGSKQDREAAQMTPQIAAMAYAVLDPMLAANSQEEFDKAVVQAIFTTQMTRRSGVPFIKTD